MASRKPLVLGDVTEFEQLQDTDGLAVSTLVLADGTVAAPALTFAADTDTGIYRNAAGQVAFASEGVVKFYVGPNYISPTIPISSIAGSLAAPGICFAGDPDTGFYSPAADTLGFVAGGVEVFRATSTLVTFNVATNISGGSDDSVITSAVTYYLAPGGSDTTGDGTEAAPWFTITKALSAINNKVIGETGSVTIMLKDGWYGYTSQVFVNHTSKRRITIRGQNTYDKTVSSVISSARWADGYGYDAVIQLNDVANIVVNDFVVMGTAASLTGTYARLISGCHRVSAVDTVNKRITVKVYCRKNAYPAAGALTGTVTVIKTMVQFSSCNGFVATDAQTVTLTKMVLVGIGGSHTGVQTNNANASFALVAPFGVSSAWWCGVNIMGGGTAIMNNTTISGPYVGLYLAQGSSVSAQGCVINGCGSDNIQACNNSSIDFYGGISCGAGSYGANFWNGVMFTANSAFFVWNVLTGCHPGWASMAEIQYTLFQYNGDGGGWRFASFANMYGCTIRDITNYGLKAESTSDAWADTCTNISNGLGFYAVNNSLISRASANVSGNTTPYSPAVGVLGNSESLIV